MSNTLLDLTATQLKRALALREKIDSLEAELLQILASGNGGNGSHSAWKLTSPRNGHLADSLGLNGHKPRRRMNAAARAKIAAIARERWAKAKAAGRNAL